jgi:2',3'-cyclic-nucleotide 2'-phosphodiesterase (5'-nucleotidase family)
VQPFVVKKKGGVKFGILGLTTETLKSVSLPENVAGIDVLDPIETAQPYLSKMKDAGAEFLIALTHLGVAGTGKRAKARIAKEDTQLASQVPGFQAIVGGHSHTLLSEGIKIKDTWIVQAGEKGEHLGRLDILWDKRKRAIVEAKAQVIPINPQLGEDDSLRALLELYQSKVGRILDQELGTVEILLDGERENVRNRETNLGDLLCDILREGTGTDIALYNGGGIRASIARGPIKLRDIYRVLPFRNTVATGTLTGKQLKEVLGEALKYKNETGSFLQVSGLEYWASGRTLKKVTVKGKKVSDGTRFRVVSNNFLMAGGDFLTAMANADRVQDTLVPVEDYVVKYVKQRGKVDAKLAGRIHLEQP